MRILGISGSFRRDSHNTRLLRAAAHLLPPGAELGCSTAWPTCRPTARTPTPTRPPPPSHTCARRSTSADALLIATPEYNASIPGVLKNAIDWASRPFPDNALRDKPVAVIGASTGLFGAVWAQAELRKVLQHTGARGARGRAARRAGRPGLHARRRAGRPGAGSAARGTARGSSRRVTCPAMSESNTRDRAAALGAVEAERHRARARADLGGLRRRGAGSLSAEPDVYKGHDGVRRYFAAFDGGSRTCASSRSSFIEEGDVVIAWMRLTGRGSVSGIDVEQESAAATWVKDGKVTRMDPYPDIESARGARRALEVGSMRRFAPAALAVTLLLCAAAPAEAANRWIQKRAPLNIAHQGGEDEFPSNTLYAFRKAVRAGADMLELDIGVTKDDKVIVMHDTTVDGKTNGHGTVVVEDAAPDQAPRRRVLVRARASRPLQPRPARLGLPASAASPRASASRRGLHGARTSACRR